MGEHEGESRPPATQVYYGALEYDGSMDWHEDRERAERDAAEYDLPLYRVTIAYERVTPPGSGETRGGAS